MTELLPFAEKWGPWIIIIVYTAIKTIPALATRLLPDLISAKREEQKLRIEAGLRDSAALIAVYERFIASHEKMVQFIGSATVAMNGMERALDGNTRTIAELAKVVERGPKCPLPDCPYWDDEGGFAKKREG